MRNNKYAVIEVSIVSKTTKLKTRITKRGEGF